MLFRSTTLSLNETDLLTDNEYQDGWQGDVQIDGSQAETDLWLPGETVTITVAGSTPSRVKLTTETGVSDSEVVS